MNNNNLTLTGFGIILRRLTEEKIELVRHWRNHPKIQRYMAYRECISAEQQKKWFVSVDNDCNYYFIVEINGKDVGVVNIKSLSTNDSEERYGESGIFLWDDNVVGKKVSYRSLLTLHDYAFDKLGLDYLISHILEDNIRSQKCYTGLGFELCDGQEDKDLQQYVLTKDKHYIVRQSVIENISLCSQTFRDGNKDD